MADQPAENPPVLAGTVVERIINAKRQPVVPAWIRDDVTRRAAVKYGIRHAGHITVFHAARSPKYAGRTLLHCPRGIARLVHRLTWWALDRQVEPLLSFLVVSNDTRGYSKLRGEQAGRVKVRLMILGGALSGVAAAASALAAAAPLAAQAGVAAVAVVVVGYLGRPLDRVWLDVPLISSAAVKPTPDVITQAIAALGIPAITKALGDDPKAIAFVAPGVGRDGPGWRADLDLPIGVTAGDVIEKRDRLASGLRRPLGCVWPETNDAEHPGRLVLFIGDQDLSATGKLPWAPLRGSGPLDMFRPLPFGADPRGRPVTVKLLYNNMLVGSIPGQGKTACVRVIACGAALDPTCELWLHELKGTGDLDPLEVVSHRFVSGIDDESIGYAAESLALLRAEVERRVARLKKLPRDICPDKRVTREISGKKSLGLHPLMCVIDECQNLFAHKAYGAQAGEDAVFIIKIGRALGVMLELATQRPDRDSLPTAITANVSIRLCLKVMGQTENDMILGTSSYKNGLNATKFRAEIDAGIGLLVGAMPASVVVKAAYIDTPACERVAVRARALREAAGTITGVAAGEEHAAAGPSILEDTAAVMTADRAHSQAICARLAELRPGMYGHLAELDPARAAAWLGAQLAAFGVRTEQVWADDRNLTGVRREAVLAALESRGSRN